MSEANELPDRVKQPSILAIIIGIDNYEKYTKPLVDSLVEHEPDCQYVVVDNASSPPYPRAPGLLRSDTRLCYSAAINAAAHVKQDADWYLVLSNDVLCKGPFANRIFSWGHETISGPMLKSIVIPPVGVVQYIEGWCVAVPGHIWRKIGGWDDGMLVSSYEDVEYSHRARTMGFSLVEDTDLPFVHLDQKQRFYLVPDYWSSEAHNRARFIERYTKEKTS